MSTIEKKLETLTAEQRELLELLLGEQAPSPTRAPITRRAAGERPCPLSFAQQRLWFLDQLEPGSPLYNVAGAVRLSGALDQTALRRSLDDVVRRHEALRTTIANVDGEGVQIVAAAATAQLDVEDLRGLDAESREAEALSRIAVASVRPFDLERGPLFRACLLCLDDEDHLLLIVMHHIISDGWSVGVLIAELAALYSAFVAGDPSPLPDLDIQYGDYAEWQRTWMRDGALDDQLAYWCSRLADAPALELPSDRPRPARRSNRGATRTFIIEADVAAGLRSLARSENATLFAVLLAAYAALLHRYSGQDDFVVGSPIAGRTRTELEPLIGFFVNTLALRADMSGDPSFRELVARMRDVALDAFAHQDLPFERLVERLHPDRDMSRTPLFQAMFVLQNAPTPAVEMPGLVMRPARIEPEGAKFDLTLTATEADEQIEGAFEFNTDLFDAGTVDRMIGCFQTFLRSAVVDPEQRLAAIPLLGEVERKQLLDWSGPCAEFPATESLHKLFERQAARRPDAVAVACGDETIAYGELDRRAERLAMYLVELGVGAETLVGVCMQRSIQTVVALLGVLKAGAAYVPLDRNAPAERLDFMIEDGGIGIVLADSDLGALNARVVRLDAEWDAVEVARAELHPTPPDSAAYVIYTSGSTGRPKGVVVTHANVVRLLAATDDWFGFSERDVWSVFHSFAFDFSVWELWGALLSGGRAVIVPYVVSRSPEAFLDLLERERVTVLNQTPSAFRQLIAAEPVDGPALQLRLVVFGGEALDFQSLKPWIERHGDEHPRLVNMYGITETTVHVTYRPVTRDDAANGRPSMLGVPIPDLRLHVLDANLEPTPVGVAGEISVGGAGVARGYLNRPALTAERFVPDPFSSVPGARLYRSGDAARVHADGDVEYLGRIDTQVKIRGHRIELGEIEARLTEIPGIAESAVVARGDADDDRQLVAYYVAPGSVDLSPADVRARLKQSLPDYMLPAAILRLEAFPLTVNGKLDRRALPSPGSARDGAARPVVGPATVEEEVLAGVWANVLGLDDVSVEDNFFDLGGDSIRSLRVVAEARARGVEFSLHEMFAHQTIRDLARRVTLGGSGRGAVGPVEPWALISESDRARVPFGVEDAYPMATLQVGMLFHSEFDDDSAVYHDIIGVHVRARLDVEALGVAVRAVVARHPILRTSFDLARFSVPMQLVHERVEVPFDVTDVGHLPSEAQDRVIADWMDAEKRRPFDPSTAPLVRFQVHIRSDETFQFSFGCHHAVLDGWSVATMVTEIFREYRRVCGDVVDAVDAVDGPAPAGYREFIALEREAIRSEAARRFWDEKLADAPFSKLPRFADVARERDSLRAGMHTIAIPPDLTQALKALARRAAVPLKSVALAAHVRVMALVTGQSDVVTGLVVNGRPEATGGERTLGLFLNTLPLRATLLEGTWIDLVRSVFAAERELLAHRRMPIAEVQKRMGRGPLFESSFNFVHFHILDGVERGGGVEVLDTVAFEQTNLPFAVNFRLHVDAVQAEIGFTFDTAELTAEQVSAIGGAFVETLKAMADDPEGRFEEALLVPERERETLTTRLNDTRRDFDSHVCIHEAFERQCAANPGRVAVVFEGESATYGELNARANRLAHHLRHLGVGPETLVGIRVERSLDMVIGLLAILKAGGAYVPLDPGYPVERLSLIVDDARLRVLLASKRFRADSTCGAVHVVELDGEDFGAFPDENPAPLAGPGNLAYVIYTSGSTGKPKGVMVAHRNVMNFFAGMDERVGCDGTDTLLAVTSISFDISVLELFWTLARGARVVLLSDEAVREGAAVREDASARAMDFSLFYFASAQPDATGDPYHLVLEGAKFADRNGFAAVWTPERHFHAFGGLYPNPSVMSAALAAVTERVAIRAGSVVLPLHHPVRVAEEWALVDNLSRGRVGIAFASGWHPHDFVFFPEKYANRKERMMHDVETVRALWRGEAVATRCGTGEDVDVRILPRPVQPELPVWITAAGNPETFVEAGRIGANVLTHLLGQTIEHLGAKIALYREALAANGHDPAAGRVTLMLHTFVGADLDTVRETVRGPFTAYLRSSAGLVASFLKAANPEVDERDLTPEELDAVLDHAFDRYFETAGLFGTPETCAAMVERLSLIVDEIACLVDFGVDAATVLDGLPRLAELKRRTDRRRAAGAYSLAAQARRYDATMMQCTPSMMKLLALDPRVAGSLQSVTRVLLGGEALAPALAARVKQMTPARLVNMYGPTETTIWSATHEIDVPGDVVPIGRPIANTQIHILDARLHHVPAGVPGDLYIGGDGLARGYLRRPDLTADRFVPDPFGDRPGARLYRTGDVARYRPCGTVEFLGRADFQVKIRGHRIELGDVEAALARHPGVAEAVAAVREDGSGEKRLVAYLVAAASRVDGRELRSFLLEKLPDAMIPAIFVWLNAFPLTPNGKIDRRALPAPEVARERETRSLAEPGSDVETTLAEIWADVLGVERVGVDDNFFELGGDSILGIQVVFKANQAGIGVTARNLFQHPTVAELASVARVVEIAQAEQGPVTGPTPLTPIQKWFFEQSLDDPHHYNQAVMFEVDEPLDEAAMREVVRRLLVQHDALRMRFEFGDGGWRQVIAAPDASVPFERIDLSGVVEDDLPGAIAAALARVQSSLDLAAGPLVRVAWLDPGAGRVGRLVLAVHHLVVDGVSWRVLLDHLLAGYEQLQRGETVDFGPKTTSFRQWSERLETHARSEGIEREAEYWLTLADGVDPRLPRDVVDGGNTVGDARTVHVAFDPDETRALLQEVPQTYNTKIDDALLTALGRAVSGWTGRADVLVDVEGHGREQFSDDLDVSHTVGWFTSLYPVRLRGLSRMAPGEALKAVKEDLRRIPNRGFGFGLLRYVSGRPEVEAGLAAIPRADVLFNYLGQFDQVFSGASRFRPASEPAGPARSLQQTRSHVLEVVGMVVEGRLRFDWTYSAGMHTEATIERLAAAFASSLREIIRHCVSNEDGGFTASDFPLAHLDDENLEHLAAALGELEDD